MDLALNRRSFFAALLAPFVARFLPKKAIEPIINVGDLTVAQPVSFNSGLMGLKYYQIDSNHRNYMGISRASYGIDPPQFDDAVTQFIEAHHARLEADHDRLFSNEIDRLMMQSLPQHWTDPSRLPA